MHCVEVENSGKSKVRGLGILEKFQGPKNPNPQTHFKEGKTQKSTFFQVSFPYGQHARRRGQNF